MVRRAGDRSQHQGIVEWTRLDGFIGELFDVAAMPGIVCPMSVGPDVVEIRSTITVEGALAERQVG